ncbi:MAG: hypothetical protein ACYC4R_11230 [Anaerolineae bacterium]
MGSQFFDSILVFGNLILSSVNLIIGFSLFAYILTHNLRSSVARAFCALIALVTVVYLVDVTIEEVDTLRTANALLRLQWLGIAFVPAAYYHFSEALLRSTGPVAAWRRYTVPAAYVVAFLAFAGAAFTQIIVGDAQQLDGMYHLTAGPLFWHFAAFYILTTISGWLNIWRARARCLTSTTRRRMSYLMLAFVAPGLAVFPYLLIPSTEHILSTGIIAILTSVGNLGAAIMTTVLGYIVAYQGVLLPDRVVKHGLLHFLLRGPLTAVLVVVVMLTVPRVEHIFGLPRETILIVTVAGAIVLVQLLIALGKPGIDRLIYRKDRREITRIQDLEQRLLTTTDLEQLLENTLIALCESLRMPSGFVVTVEEGSLSLRVFCGHREAATDFLAKASLPELLDALAPSRQNGNIIESDFVAADGHWLLPLRGRGDAGILGVLGIRELDGQRVTLDGGNLEMIDSLVRRAERALEDMGIQKQVFGILQRLESELDQIQEWRSMPQYANPGRTQYAQASPAFSQGLMQTIKDALGHYWGGPKLSHSSLLRLQIVRDEMTAHDSVPAKAVRAVLQEAIMRLRPSGERSMTANEWTVFNILDLRFVQGQKIRDVALRLSMSESDYYRKQRIAIEQVTETLIQMEQSRQQANGSRAK